MTPERLVAGLGSIAETRPTNKMRAAVLMEYGGPEVLNVAHVSTPELGPGEVLVKVHAAAVNAFDLMNREGRFRPNKTFPHILGCDFGGEVVDVRDGASSWPQIGARVTGLAGSPCRACEQCLTGHRNRCAIDARYLGAHLPGTYAQFVKVPGENLVEIPANISWEQAAAFTTVFGTAWRLLVSRAEVRLGETVLIRGASSGVGTAAIQIARFAGAHVYAVTSTEWKAEKASRLGANEVLVDSQVDVVTEITKRTGGRGVDIVVEHVGAGVFPESVRCLRPGGRLVTCGATAGSVTDLDLSRVGPKEISIFGSNAFTVGELRAMLPLLAGGILRPVIDSVYPLHRASEAHQRVHDRKHFGKVVLSIDHEANEES